ncbi:MAG TPA: fumarylacetoacetate hydrolase family protein [Polyangia bacterium]|nr:fumarylacetoacetate hydrolase family protein [Polyangia bacterium]
MRLATLRDGSRDGALLVVASDGRRCARAREVAPTLQAALDDWRRAAPALGELAARLEAGTLAGEPLDEARLGPPLPRAYEWIDGSAFLNHVRLVRRARHADPPATLETDPLVYQGGSGALLGPRDAIPLGDPAWGLDFEAEVAVILGDIPRGTTAANAGGGVRLVLLANDVTLRNLVPGELAKGFGFFQSKPATAFSPFAVTPDELAGAWRDGRVHLPLRTTLARAGQAPQLAGDPDAGPEMHFSFFDLIAHAGRTRDLTAGTILGSGTVSNADPARGVSCLAELRARETIAGGAPMTPFLAAGDVVTIEMRAADGRDIFGRLTQTVVPG